LRRQSHGDVVRYRPWAGVFNIDIFINKMAFVLFGTLSKFFDPESDFLINVKLNEVGLSDRFRSGIVRSEKLRLQDDLAAEERVRQFFLRRQNM
jgi:hypothetical protein